MIGTTSTTAQHTTVLRVAALATSATTSPGRLDRIKTALSTIATPSAWGTWIITDRQLFDDLLATIEAAVLRTGRTMTPELVLTLA